MRYSRQKGNKKQQGEVWRTSFGLICPLLNGRRLCAEMGGKSSVLAMIFFYRHHQCFYGNKKGQPEADLGDKRGIT
ncbi:hypothetical protein A3K86_09905 [Photobacterium jeanii]|uniref:Uncharacterized protein n=1 Tax=Photobacterium jeanii TaxID=858640 RepID=A0A178KHP8_9GAMM|nr:hypothetical protein A3K86_09905 [Photobacterium jeanii]PST87480.1 hypothetical protein C9I91_19575 [Photobacterium jeanii]